MMFVQNEHMDAKDWRELSKYNAELDLMTVIQLLVKKLRFFDQFHY